MSEPQAPKTDAEVVRRGLTELAARLPAAWSTSLTPAEGPVDARIEVRDPSGATITFLVEAKGVVDGRDISTIRERLDELEAQEPGAQRLLMARYLSEPVRTRLTDAGVSYVDATGNLRVEVTRPGLFIADRGADRDPWRGPGRPRGTLKGEPAAKIVRALADFTGPWTARELVEVSKASTGATYRVIDFLEREGLAARDDSGRFAVPDVARLLRRWSTDYGFVRSNQTSRWIAPRGIPGLLDQVASPAAAVRYAVTGTLAAAEWAAYAPARLAMVYVADVTAAVDAWDLRPADAGANVLLAEPAYEVVFERSSTTVDGVVVAAPSQVVVDLMTGPGRNPNEAEELLDWMVRNERSWRT